jgi:hypothetical protein
MTVGLTFVLLRDFANLIFEIIKVDGLTLNDTFNNDK